MSAEDLNVLRDDLMQLPAEEVKDPSIPVDIAIQESENLYSWCIPDKGKFLKLSLTEDFLSSLLIRGGALRETESLWVAKRDEVEGAQEAWIKDSKSAYQLRDQILHDFRYAYRKSENIMKKLRKIGSGNGHADMIQDLNDLSVIGREYFEPLNKIDYDMSLLERASVTADNMGRSLAEANAEDGYNEALDLRNRAFAYLKVVVDEVRAAGKYIFWKNEEKLKGYRSEYRHKINQAGKKKGDGDIVS